MHEKLCINMEDISRGNLGMKTYFSLSVTRTGDQ